MLTHGGSDVLVEILDHHQFADQLVGVYEDEPSGDTAKLVVPPSVPDGSFNASVVRPDFRSTSSTA